MQQALLQSSSYSGGYYAFKNILRYDEGGSKIISHENTGWQHFKSDYISSAWLNPDGTRVPYCIPLDIDVKDTDKKWLDLEGKINWEKAVAFLQKKYPEVFGYLLFVVRSTGGKGIHLGIAISPIVKDGSLGSQKAINLAVQVQERLIRLLISHGLGADRAARGVVRDLPNWRRLQASEHSKAHQLFYDNKIHNKIKRERLSVLSELARITNEIPECKKPAKKEQIGLLHINKTTEARLASLYVDLFENLGQCVCYTMAELIKLTGISRATLRNILIKNSKTPKWLNVNYLGRTEGYELWITPEFGDIERAEKLIRNPEYAQTFLEDLPPPEEVQDGSHNQYVTSVAIHYKHHGCELERALKGLESLVPQIPGHADSDSCKNYAKIAGSIYRNEPHLFGCKSNRELPQVLEGKSKVKVSTEGGVALVNAHYSLAFTRRGNEKRLINLESKEQIDSSIVEGVVVKGTGYKLQLRAIQELLAKLEKKPSKLIIKGRSMLQGNPVVQKFAKYHGFEFEFAERSKEDKRIINEFRDESLGSELSMPLEVNLSTNLSELVEASLRNCNWVLGFFEKAGKGLTPIPEAKCRYLSILPDTKGEFVFPEFDLKKVRCDGYVAYLDNYYWLGDSWIGRKLQVVDDGTKVEFFIKAQFIKEYKRLDGKGAKTEGGTNSQWHKAKSLDSTYRRKAQKVGPSFDQLILAQIEKGQGIINTKSIFGFLRLMDSWPYEQLEAVAKYCAKRRNLSYRFFNSCLEAGVE